MCGINGILRRSPEAPPVELSRLITCRDRQARRGPDDAGSWVSPCGQLGLGHRRLSIVDLSPAGAQPMSTPDGRFTVVLNGEIYNYRELRAELSAQGFPFRSQSDTEVILALYSRYGAQFLPRLRGMFALALWDQGEQSLLLARDPLGIKPLYWAEEQGQLLFASQVKALAAVLADTQVDPVGLAGFLLWGSVPEPRTIRRAIRALPAGCWLRVEDGRLDGPNSFYQVKLDQGVPDESSDATSLVATALADSVRAHLVADVPVALFLSAGLDSSLLAALASRGRAEPLTTLTLAFDELAGTDHDEAPLARETARRLGTDHRERRVGRERFASLWAEVADAMDQPSIDGFNTYLVAQLVREEGFKVVLSGLGGDELFGSYPSFTDVPGLRRLARRGRWLGPLGGLWPLVSRLAFPGRPKLAGLLRHGGDLPGAYFLRRGLFLPEELPALLGKATAQEALAAYNPSLDGQRILEQAGDLETLGHQPWLAVHQLETHLYMRNQLLRDADWASMAHSVELRVPLVDEPLRTALARTAFALPRRLGKAGLVRAVAPELPAEVFTRPKSGFYIPVAEWMAPGAKGGSSRGAGSRRLALAVLAAQGIELPGALSS